MKFAHACLKKKIKKIIWKQWKCIPGGKLAATGLLKSGSYCLWKDWGRFFKIRIIWMKTILRTQFKICKNTRITRGCKRKRVMCTRMAVLEWGLGVQLWLLLVVVGAAVILSKFSLSTLLHVFKYLTSLHFWVFSDYLKSLTFGLTSKSFDINSSYKSLKYAEKFILFGLPFLIAEELKAEESYPIGFSLRGWP